MHISEEMFNPIIFSEKLFEIMKRINPGVDELELYEFRYCLDNLIPSDGGWGSITPDQVGEIEQAISSRDFYIGIELRPNVENKIVLDKTIARLTRMLLVGLVSGAYTEEWVGRKFYFDVRGFYFLPRTEYFIPSVLSHFDGKPYKTFEPKQKGFSRYQAVGYKDFKNANMEIDQFFIDSVMKIINRKGTPILITLAGPTAAGKTEIVARLRSTFNQASLRVSTIEMDNFLTDTEYREANHIDSMGIEAFHFKIFMESITRLLRGEKVSIPRYSYGVSSHDPQGKIKPGKTMLEVEPADVIFIEGNFPFQINEVAPLIGIKVVYLTDDPIRLKRKWKRDIDYRKKYDLNYFRNRFFRTQFLRAVDCYHSQMAVCDMIVFTTAAELWATPEMIHLLDS
jgi:uridine kinase